MLLYKKQVKNKYVYTCILTISKICVCIINMTPICLNDFKCFSMNELINYNETRKWVYY